MFIPMEVGSAFRLLMFSWSENTILTQFLFYACLTYQFLSKSTANVDIEVMLSCAINMIASHLPFLWTHHFCNLEMSII